ncbi:MAG: membrane protein insertion efficiency factor YidD [Candidatus Caenarcaniphilales bacterium]|nr:membrane protein insertion efficiency factor YidD [Candidatus Caenarcaniphilales bacterium]
MKLLAYSFMLRVIIITSIEIYRLAFSWSAPVCRFQPTCSHYAQDAIRLYGVLAGLRLAFNRVLRCHPWQAGGFDPVR